LDPPSKRILKAIDPAMGPLFTDKNFKSMFKAYGNVINDGAKRLKDWGLKLYYDIKERHDQNLLHSIQPHMVKRDLSTNININLESPILPLADLSPTVFSPIKVNTEASTLAFKEPDSEISGSKEIAELQSPDKNSTDRIEQDKPVSERQETNIFKPNLERNSSIAGEPGVISASLRTEYPIQDPFTNPYAPNLQTNIKAYEP
jgi:hypothetical protein